MTLVWPNGTTDEPARSDGYGPRPSIETLRSIGSGTVIESGRFSVAGSYVPMALVWQVDT